ncbi:hypothetical protein [Sanyastnella coralliicola]|uniref:hypothetical protein n=1 Tax=Sanyastnella coralliicola TaxID=3069118 RepID=UPI0027B8C69B|nr:hypothetical protein [Longitalea sp. SCSIO 12813]
MKNSLIVFLFFLSSCIIYQDLEHKDGLIPLEVGSKTFQFYGDYIFHNPVKRAFQEDKSLGPVIKNIRFKRDLLYTGHTYGDPYCGVVILPIPQHQHVMQAMKIPFITSEPVVVNEVEMVKDLYKLRIDDTDLKFIEYRFEDNGQLYMIAFWADNEKSSWLERESMKIMKSIQ